jgi:23S rRNA pseudouridine1911/1915/1917 synthase
MTDTLLERLGARFPQSSRRSLRQWLEAGRVHVNGRVVRDGRTAVGARDRIELGAPTGARAGPGLQAGVRLVHEDDALLVVDKPPGLLTIATERERARTLYRLVWDYLAARHPGRRPFIVHRLDRETSGLVVLAKSPEAKRHLQAQFESRTVERIYLAVVEGRVSQDQGTLESWLTQDASLRVRAVRARRGPPEGGKQAITRYRVLERRADTTLLELSLVTGRRGQIRAQLSRLGHPIVGDRGHGSRAGGRVRLHACRLGFAHPATGAPARFESPAPPAVTGAGATV